MSNFKVGDMIKLNKFQHMPTAQPNWVEGEVVEVNKENKYVIKWSDGFEDYDDSGYCDYEIEAV